jgi:hypothetical protein
MARAGSQLPLLYRNPVEHGWNECRQGAGENPPMALDPETTSVVWAQAAVVCAQLEFAEGGWIGPELTVSAL